MNKITNTDIAQAFRAYLKKGEHPLEPPQVAVYEEIIVDVENGNNSGGIKRPTGTGKTVLFSALIDGLKDLIFSSRGSDYDGALIIVDTVNAALQAYETLTIKKRRDGSKKPLFGWSPDDVKIYHGSGPKATKELKEAALKAPLVIMTLAAYCSRRAAGDKLRERRFAVIIDEVDAAKGRQRTPAIRELTKYNFVWGLSATDTYATPTGFVSVWKELFDRNLPIHNTSLLKAAAQKEICPTRNILFVADIESGIDEKLAATDREYTSDENRIIIERPGRDYGVIKAITEFVDPETGIAFKDLNQIWYCYGVEHAKGIAAQLNIVYGNQVNPDGSPLYPYGYAVAVSGETPKEDYIKNGVRRLGLNSILKFHKQSIIPVLANADLLIRSFDAPEAELCVMLRASRSPQLIEQSGGRITRPNFLNPYKLGYVASVIDRDMTGALVFADVSGDARLGMSPGMKYATNNKPRFPKLERLNSDQAVNVDVYSKKDDIDAFLLERKANREAQIGELSPVKPEKFLTAGEFEKRTGFSWDPVQSFFKAVKTGFSPFKDDPEEKSFSIGSFKFSTAEVGYFRNSDKERGRQFYIHEKHIPAFEIFVLDVQKWGRTSFTPVVFVNDPHWFSPNEIADLANCYRGAVRGILKRMIPAGQGYMGDPQQPKRRWRITSQPRPLGDTLCVHRDDLAEFLNYYNLGVIHKDSLWLSPEQLASKVGADLKSYKSIVSEIKKMTERLQKIENEPHLMLDPVTGRTWTAQILRYANDGGDAQYSRPDDKTGICLFQDEIERFKKFYQSGFVTAPQEQTDKKEEIKAIQGIFGKTHATDLPNSSIVNQAVASVAMPLTEEKNKMPEAEQPMSNDKPVFVQRILNDAVPIRNDYPSYSITVRYGGEFTLVGWQFPTISTEITKPIDDEIPAPPLENTPAESSDIVLDFTKRTFQFRETAIKLLEAEFLIFYKLVSMQGIPVTSHELSQFIGKNIESGICPQDSTLAKNLSYLRSKLRSLTPELADSIVTLSKGVYQYEQHQYAHTVSASPHKETIDNKLPFSTAINFKDATENAQDFSAAADETSRLNSLAMPAVGHSEEFHKNEQPDASPPSEANAQDFGAAADETSRPNSLAMPAVEHPKEFHKKEQPDVSPPTESAEAFVDPYKTILKPDHLEPLAPQSAAEQIQSTVKSNETTPNFFKHLYPARFSTQDREIDERITELLIANNITSYDALVERSRSTDPADRKLAMTGGELERFKRRIKQLGVNSVIQAGNFQKALTVSQDDTASNVPDDTVVVFGRNGKAMDIVPVADLYKSSGADQTVPVNVESQQPVKRTYSTFSEVNLKKLDNEAAQTLARYIKKLTDIQIHELADRGSRMCAAAAVNSMDSKLRKSGDRPTAKVLVRIGVLYGATGSYSVRAEFIARFQEVKVWASTLIVQPNRSEPLKQRGDAVLRSGIVCG